ncbi:MAG: alpha/beta hydrolase [Halomonas sp.]|nr:alpha/beta hydrolase [Halomonas sp.]TVP49257.1 MAG: alpha/beta hydrolase [Halomonas sp.]
MPIYADKIQDFINICDGIMPRNYHKLPLYKQRNMYEILAQTFDSNVANNDVEVNNYYYLSDESKDNKAFRIYKNNKFIENGVVFYIRGGGFVLGSLDTHNSLMIDICIETGLTVIAPDFRLAPEYPYPAPLNDCLDIFKYVVSNNKNLGLNCNNYLISGDSSGANMAVALCMMLRDINHTQFKGQVLFNPVLDFTRWVNGGVDAPLLTSGEMEFYTQCYVNNNDVYSDHISPLINQNFNNLPPAYIMAAEMDSLKEDSVNYFKSLTDLNIPAEIVVEKGLVHGSIRARNMSNAAHNAFKKACNKMLDLIND